MIELLVTLAVFLLVGAATSAVLQLLLPQPRVARLAMLFLVGVGANGTILYLLGTLGVPLRFITFLALPLLAAIILVLRWRTLATLSNAPQARHLVAGLVTAVPLVVLLCAAAVMPTRDYDGRVTWLPKARAIAFDGSVAGPFFQGQRGLNLHNRYPLLIPLDAATIMTLTGRLENETARWLYPLIAVAVIVVLRSLLIAWFGPAGAWTVAAMAWLPVLTAIEGGALASYNDLALAAFFGVAVLYLIASPEHPNALRVAGLFSAFAVLTKNEGLALAIAVLCAAVVARRLKSVANWTWTILPVIAAQALVSSWRMQVPAAYDEQYGVLVATLPTSLDRAPAAMRALLTHAVNFSEWGIFWIAFAIAVLIAAWTARSARFAIPLVAILAALGAYTLALTVTSWRIDDLAAVAANRLLSHLLLPAASIIAMAIHGIGEPARRTSSVS
jgi:hypothetical protein